MILFLKDLPCTLLFRMNYLKENNILFFYLLPEPDEEPPDEERDEEPPDEEPPEEEPPE
jgi:hypothetical protein